MFSFQNYAKRDQKFMDVEGIYKSIALSKISKLLLHVTLKQKNFFATFALSIILYKP